MDRAEELFHQYRDFARSIAYRVSRRRPWERDDILQDADIGLWDAARRYQPEDGVPFLAYARTRIRGEIGDGIRTRVVLDRRGRDESGIVGQEYEELSQRLGRLPGWDEVMRSLGWDDRQSGAALRASQASAMTELEEWNHPVTGNEPEESALAADLRETVDGMIAQLPGDLATVIHLRHYQDMKHHEIGDVLGVGESRACQLHTQAIKQLRTMWEEAA